MQTVNDQLKAKGIEVLKSLGYDGEVIAGNSTGWYCAHYYVNTPKMVANYEKDTEIYNAIMTKVQAQMMTVNVQKMTESPNESPMRGMFHTPIEYGNEVKVTVFFSPDYSGPNRIVTQYEMTVDAFITRGCSTGSCTMQAKTMFPIEVQA